MPPGGLPRGRVGLHKAALEQVNCEKLQEIVQDRWENPSQFLECLTEARLQWK